MPWTMGAFAIGSLGLAGVPPVNGFVSKWFLALGALEADHLVVLGIYVLSGLLNAGYFFPIVHRAFFREGEHLEGHREASALMVVPLVITAMLSVLIGVCPDLFFHFYELASLIAQSLTGGLL
jgi:multicomponent Na+:H+ antiporter subunit D